MSPPTIRQTVDEEVIALIRARTAMGREKYGVTVDRTDLNDIEWVTHAIEEAADMLKYLVRLRRDLQAARRYLSSEPQR